MADEASYGSQLRDPRWKQLARDVRQTYGGVCASCKQRGKSTHIHHIRYEPGKKAWEYERGNFVVLCETCHALVHRTSKYWNALTSAQNANHSAALVYQLDRLIQRNGMTWLLRRLVELEAK